MTGWKNELRRLGITVLALVLICSVAVAAMSFPFTTVTTEKVHMRRSASSSAVILETLDAGASVEVVGESGNYFHVKANNRDGYILKKYINTDAGVIVTPTPEPVETVSGYPYTTVTRDTVNLRASRSTRSALLKKIPSGASVTVAGISGSWAEVSYGRFSGYVKKEYLVLKVISKVKPTPTPTPVPTLTPEEDAAGYKVLQKGDSGPEVKALQEALIELGYLNGSADGKFGDATLSAVVRLQTQNAYPSTGLVDANLQAFLYAGKPKNAKGEATKVNTLSPVAGVTIKKGNTGDAVGELQEQLKALGYYSGSITRVFDAATQAAVKAFQKKNGLKSDGVAGQETRAALAAAGALGADATPTPKPTPTPTPAPTYTVPSAAVKLNSAGEEARTVQRRLKELGYYRGNVDGKFGQASVAALKKFQAAHGLKEDGVAGKSTYTVLFSENALKKGATATPRPTPTPTPEPTGSATLREGDGGDPVALLQEYLIALDYMAGPADGNYGTKTTEAVKAFQAANGLKADGIAGRETLDMVYSGNAKAATAAATPVPASAGTKAAATAAPAATASLRKGDTGSAVKNLQSRLIQLGYLSGSADGIFGRQTFQAVVAFQQKNKLKADGIAGTQTQGRLESSSAVAASGTAAPAAPAATATPAPASLKPNASSVLYANWYTTIKSVAKKYPYATVYDFATGISWQIHIFSLGAHADYEPLTANDTKKMERVFGGNTWNPRAVWVVFANGSVYIGSTHSNPHDVQHITDNQFPGHSCLHFPRTQEQVTAIGPYATSHQETIDAGWARTQQMAR